LRNPGIAIVFPFIDTAPRASRPVVVLGLIAANVFVFLWICVALFGLAFSHAAGADGAAGASHIFNEDRLTEGDLHPLGEVARNHIRCSAGRKRHHDSDRPRRVGLRPSDARDSRQRGGAR